MFLPNSLTSAANNFVMQQPAERNPRFPRKEFPGAVTVGGSVLRYSTATQPPAERSS